MDSQVKTIVKGLAGIAVAASAAAVGIGVLVKSAINTNDELSKLSQKLSISTEDLTALKFAAEFSGVSIGNLDGALSAMTRRFNNFDKGGGAAKDAFTALGIATRDVDGNLRGINDVFIEVAEKMSKMEAGVEKTAIAQDIFSKSQAKIIPLLNEGAAGLEAFRVKAEALGLILSEKTAKASEEFNDKLDMMGKITTGLGAKLAEKLLPTLNKLADKMLAMAESQDFEDFLNGIVVAVDLIVTAFGVLVLAFDALKVVTNVVAGNMDEANKQGEELLVTFDELLETMKNLGRPSFTITAITKDKTKGSKGKQAEGDFTFKGSLLTGELDDYISRMEEAKFLTADLIDRINQADVSPLADKMNSFYDQITDQTTQFANVFTSAFEGLEDGLMDFVKNGKLNFSDLASSIINDIARIAIRQAIMAPLVGGLTGALSSGAGSMFGGFFAKGGRPDTSKVSVIGERGPELFVPDTAGRVIPNNQLGGGGGTPNVIFNIENKSGTQVQESSTSASFDGKNFVINTIIEAIGTNKNNIRQSVKGIR